jgi:hypothetical protein
VARFPDAIQEVNLGVPEDRGGGIAIQLQFE